MLHSLQFILLATFFSFQKEPSVPKLARFCVCTLLCEELPQVFLSLSDLNFRTLFKSLGILYLFILFFQGAPGAPGPDGLTGTKGSMVSDVKCIKFMREVLHV